MGAVTDTKVRSNEASDYFMYNSFNTM